MSISFPRLSALLLLGLGILSMPAHALAADPTSSDAKDPAPSTPTELKEQLINRLPPVVGDGLEIDAWAWLAYTHTTDQSADNFGDGELSLSITKTFGQRLVISAEGNFLDAAGYRRGEFEQGYASVLVSDATQTIVTVGKFNANFGIEPRDFWNRTTGTTSLLFGAQPQDLVGIMVTQPIGDTSIKLKPFVSADFQGEFNFDQSPSAGMQVQYQPRKEIGFSVTNWVGPGFVDYEGRHIPPPYKSGAYGASGADVLANWQGPNLTAAQGGTLYFLDANATWKPRNDLTLAAEYLMATSGISEGRWGWSGLMVLADYDVSDRLNVFARWSYLNDADWLVTGIFQRAQEVSGGVGYKLAEKVELRGEYRHDFSSAVRDVDSVSIHLTVGI